MSRRREEMALGDRPKSKRGIDLLRLFGTPFSTTAPATCRLVDFAATRKGSVMSDRGSRLYRGLLLNAVALVALLACNAETLAQTLALTHYGVTTMVDWVILAGVIVIAIAMYLFERG
jgi:hypothetical protein